MQDQREMVDAVLQDTGAIKECPVHGELLDNLDSGAVEEAIAEGIRMIEGGEMSGDAEEWERRIRARMVDTPDECPLCPDPDRG
ncbi:hypothetical protein [Shinella zoogloeoides]|uniref:hypothetical protein n=1 Tax=Shinella zoogloeoides TaxID=352475 RepID=UPI00273F94A0|nr:hypothetical protein [Shinella zoogloeoides]WLR90955.1 hypothetical protein Q9316_00835 [Shinella zoogloeoides]